MFSSFAIVLIGLAQTPPGDDFTQSSIARAYKEITPAVCLVSYSSEVTNPSTGETTKRDSSALGLLVSAAGLAMAPGHMSLENAEPFNINVTVGHGDNEQKYAATPLKKPDDINVCFLKLQSDTPLNLPHVTFAKGVQLGIGEPILTFGVLSETLDYARGAFTCRVGAILEKPRRTYCIDSPLRFGFVGGPVVNGLGQAVGVVGFDLTAAEGGDLYIRSGQPLVYQADLFQKYIDEPPSETEVIAHGEEAWLGVFTQPLGDDFAEYWNLPKEGGVVVSSIVSGTPAEQAGMKSGDVIVNFNGTPLHCKQDREVIGFTKLVREAGIGKTVPLRVLREGKPLDLQIKLVERPKSAREAGEFKDEKLGLTVREITTDVRIVLNLSEAVKGVIIRRVKSGGAADLANMRPGIIIMNLGDYSITSLDDYKGAIDKIAAQKPKEVTAFCRAGAATGFFRLEPRWDNE